MTALPTIADILRTDQTLNDIDDANARWTMARVRLTERRRCESQQATWSPFDQNVPTEPITCVLDLDGDAWDLTGSDPAGPWRMRGFDPGQHETRAGDELNWQRLAYEYGPLTAAVPGSAGGDR